MSANSYGSGHEYYVKLVITLIFLVSVVFLHKFTGFVTGPPDEGLGVPVSISIRERVNGAITAFNINDTISIFDRQYMDSEFTNTGTTNYTAQITLRVYRLNGTFLNLSATYQDSTVFMTPSDRRAFNVVYTTNVTGIYFVQNKVDFGTRSIEEWKSFIVHNGTLPGGGGSGSGTGSSNATGGTGTTTPGPITIVERTFNPPFADMNISSPSRVELKQGDSTLIDIHITNIGDANLTDIRLSVSTLSIFDIDITPKVMPVLGGNSTIIFLVSVTADAAAELGSQPFEFIVVSKEASKKGSLDLVVVPGGLSADDIRQRITNYQILILDIEREILEAKLQGFNTGAASAMLEKAKADLDKARRAFGLGDYDYTLEALKDTKKDIQDTLMILSVSMMSFKEATAAIDLSWLLIILLLVLLAIIAFLLYRRKKRKQRPRMLREATEGS